MLGHKNISILLLLIVKNGGGLDAEGDSVNGQGHCSSRNGVGSIDTGTEPSCVSLEKNEEDPGAKYSKSSNEDWSRFLGLVNDAERQYNETKGAEQYCKDGSCACYHFVIDKDLEPFMAAGGITSDMIAKASTRGVLYQVRDGRLYRDRECKFPARCAGIEHFLLEIVNELPDMEFVINVSDYPQVPKWVDTPSPVLSFSKTAEFSDIIYPAWSFWEGGPSISIFPTGLGRWDLLRKTLMKTAKANPWHEKKPLAFFRGSRTSGERDSLILLSRARPDLVDAQFTKNQAWRSNADTLGYPAAGEVKLEDHCQYKYLFNFRGVAASFRLKHLFLCRSLVFHVGEEWQEFFYFLLKPWIHYIPVKKESTETELRSLIEFAKSHEDIAKKIADRGYSFIKSYLKLSQADNILSKFRPSPSGREVVQVNCYLNSYHTSAFSIHAKGGTEVILCRKTRANYSRSKLIKRAGPCRRGVKQENLSGVETGYGHMSFESDFCFSTTTGDNRHGSDRWYYASSMFSFITPSSPRRQPPRLDTAELVNLRQEKSPTSSRIIKN